MIKINHQAEAFLGVRLKWSREERLKKVEVEKWGHHNMG